MTENIGHKAKETESLQPWEVAKMLDDLIDDKVLDDISDTENEGQQEFGGANAPAETQNDLVRINAKQNNSNEFEMISSRTPSIETYDPTNIPDIGVTLEKETNIDNTDTNTANVDHESKDSESKTKENENENENENEIQGIKNQFMEFEQNAQVKLSFNDNILHRLFVKRNWDINKYNKIATIVTKKWFVMIYFLCFWTRIGLYGMLGQSHLISMLFNTTYLFWQFFFSTLMNYNMTIYNMKQFAAIYKTLYSIIFVIHFLLLANDTTNHGFVSSFFQGANIVFALGLGMDTFFAINSEAINVSEFAKLWLVVFMISMFAYGYVQAYYLVHFNYYLWSWTGIDSGWDANLVDYQYKLFGQGSDISSQNMVMSSSISLILFFAKQAWQKFKKPCTIQFDTSYTIVKK